MAPRQQRPLVGSVKAQKAVIANVAHVYDSSHWVLSQRDIAAEIVKELEDRRVLFNDYELEIPHHVVDSVRQIREVLHRKLIAVREEGALSNHLRHRQSSDHRNRLSHLSESTRPTPPKPGGLRDIHRPARFETCVGETRDTNAAKLGAWPCRVGRGRTLGVDAAVLGFFAVAGSTRALADGLSFLPALVLGVVTTVGGGSLLDFFRGRSPKVFERASPMRSSPPSPPSSFWSAKRMSGNAKLPTSVGIATGFLMRALALRLRAE